jgi:hypothetical protein
VRDRYHPFPLAPGARNACPKVAELGCRRSPYFRPDGGVLFMTCREFSDLAEGLTLAELAKSDDEQLVAHGRECANCSNWLQGRQALAGAMQNLRSATSGMEAPLAVEYAVMRAFRQQLQPVATQSEAAPIKLPRGLSPFFGRRAYAALAAVVAIALGLGVWFWRQQAESSGPQAVQTYGRSVSQSSSSPPSAANTAERPSAPAQASSSPRLTPDRESSSKLAARQASTDVSSQQSLARFAQAQGYVPMMLCDPLSCSGDEAVMRVELPASSVDGSRDASEPLMADVVVGDDGLVRAIRIVPQ